MRYSHHIGIGVTAACALCHALSSSASTLYVWTNSPSPATPFTNWTTAAHAIQDAVDAASPGDTVLVTNGVYSSGGRPFSGDLLTNRVAIGNGISVVSVNGPAATVIQGQGPLGSNAVRCAYLGANATLVGFTLEGGHTRIREDGYSDDLGGGGALNYGVISNCIITGNTASEPGGGVFYGTVRNSTITSNQAQMGGGVFGADLRFCVLADNTASAGGGAAQGTLENCRLTRNSAGGGGGAFASDLTNCELTYNSANSGGGSTSFDATLQNCTLTGNRATESGGGTLYGTLRNCIVYHNTAPLNPNYDAGATFEYSCTTPLPSGAGNITNEPELASASHLSTNSLCAGAGNFAYASGVDIDGHAWQDPPSMGCDEVIPGTSTGALLVSIEAQFTNAATGFAIEMTGVIDGQPTGSRWSLGDGFEATNLPFLAHAWNTSGQFTLTLTTWNDEDPGGVSTSVTVTIASNATRYVDANNTAPAYPFTDWSTAATTIQDAVDAAVPGGSVLVSNGTYSTGGRPVIGSLINRVAIDKPIAVTSVNGPALTIIQGLGPLGSSAVRCAYVGTNAMLSGFTLTNGFTKTDGDETLDRSGGGVWCEQSGTISNCILTGNTAFRYGGGAHGGRYFNCWFLANVADVGGGVNFGGHHAPRSALSAPLHDCTLMGNSANIGGGSRLGTLWNCLVISNSAHDGGGAVNSIFHNSILIGNAALSNGGAVAVATAYNSILMNNTAGVAGGGAYYGDFINCTIVSNSAGSIGGGTYWIRSKNSIIYFNNAPSYSNYAEIEATHTCASPQPGGDGNFAEPPAFVNIAAGDLRLAFGSPCIDGGTNLSTATTNDVDGVYDAVTNDFDDAPRPVDGDLDGTNAYDIGAYEYSASGQDTDGDGIIDQWEVDHTLNPTNVSDGVADSDLDGDSNHHEYLADTDPQDDEAYFRLTAVQSTSDATVVFSASTSRIYSLEFTTNLVEGMWVGVDGETNVPGSDLGSMTMMDTNRSDVLRNYRVGVALP